MFVSLEDALFWLSTLLYVLIGVRFALMVRNIPDRLQ